MTKEERGQIQLQGQRLMEGLWSELNTWKDDGIEERPHRTVAEAWEIEAAVALYERHRANDRLIWREELTRTAAKLAEVAAELQGILRRGP